MIGYSNDFHLEEYLVYFWFRYGKWILRLYSLSSRNLNFCFIKFSLVTYFYEPVYNQLLQEKSTRLITNYKG